ncbi:MAG: amidase family protein [Gammaproteobacteria bacterium]|nr:amidase family protein [Gammaproteobacteria bacterium]
MNTLSFPCLLLSACSFVSCFAQESSDPWAAYDEAADLAVLAQLENERMHYQLLRSPLQRGAALWSDFEAELADFGEAQYEALKPLILGASIDQLQQAVDSGELSYETLTRFYLYRIRETENDPARYLNAVISLNPAALELARERDGGHGENHDPIFGMPVLLKDNVGAAGMPTTAGAIALAANETDNAFIAERLIERGAIVLGKANLSEWAYFFCGDCPSGWSAMGGQTLNPYGRLVFGTGGSSSGSGSAIAAEYAVAAVGSETSGSILSPASANSLIGLKPTTGSLSRTGVVPISATLDTTGPMARSVADAVALFNAMTGYDEDDLAMPRLAEDLMLEYRLTGLSGKRLGLLESMTEDAFYQEAADLLATDGATIEPVSFAWESPELFSEFLGAEMVRDLAAYLADHAGAGVEITSVSDLRAFNLEDPTRMPYGQAEVDMMAELDYGAEELEALRAELQSYARLQMENLFSQHDLDVLLSLNNMHAGVAALANFPALTIPAGYRENGRPVGLTLIAPSFQEQVLIDIGAEFERLTMARRPAADYQ